MKFTRTSITRARLATGWAALAAACLIVSAVALADPRREAEDTPGGSPDGFLSPTATGANLAVNPSFADGLSGWTTVGAGTFAWQPEGVLAPHSGETVGPPTITEFGLHDNPQWVSDVPAAGTRYRLSAWVWGDNSCGAASIRVVESLKHREIATQSSEPVILCKTEWRKVQMDYVARNAHADLDIQVINAPNGPGQGFHVDDMSVRQVLDDVPPDMALPATVTLKPGQPFTLDVVAWDPDSPSIVEFTANLANFPANNRPTFVPNADRTTGRLTWTPRAGDAREAPYEAFFTVANAKFHTMSTKLVVGNLPQNFVRNDGFEDGLGGWAPYRAAVISRVPGDRQGSWAAQVQGLKHPEVFGIDDTPQWVNPVVAEDAMYRFSAWVRSENGLGNVRFRIQEQVNGVPIGFATLSPEMPLRPEWQLMSYLYSTRQAGSTLSMAITDSPVAKGESFQVDLVSATLVGNTGVGSIEPPGGKKGTGALAQAQPLTFAVLVGPNPARGTATLSLTLPKPGQVRVEVFDLAGRHVNRVADGGFESGTHRFALSEAPLPGGVYFYRVQSDSGERHGRFVILD